MKTRKSWREKLEDCKDLPRVEVIPDRMKAKWGRGTLLIPAPKEVDELMRRVPKGRVTTINNIRAALAKKHGATVGCPMTIGIFAWIAANAAQEEAAQKPRARITPYWRTLKSGGVLNGKYPGGIANQKRRLEGEGHTVIKNGKNHVVADFEQSLFDFVVGPPLHSK
jgi:alkylated DNA nucleotide flippase Atl1